MSDTQDFLFKPYSMGGLELPNRIVMPPMTRARAGLIPTPQPMAP